MTISAYVGLPGNGKSYGVTEHCIIPALKSGIPVLTNIPLNDDLCLTDFGNSAVHFHTQHALEDPNFFDNIPGGTLVVIDECWRLWPAGTQAKHLPGSHQSFLAEHRHRVGENGKSMEIVLVTQDLNQIANFVRTLIETTFRVSKLSALGAEKRYRVDVYSGPVTGHNPPVHKRDREIFGKFTKDIYKYYQSHTQSSTGAGDEERIDKRFKKGGVVLYFWGAIYVIGIVILIWGLLNFNLFGDDVPSQNSPNDLPSPSTPMALPVSPVASDREWVSSIILHPALKIVSNLKHSGKIYYTLGIDDDEDYSTYTDISFANLAEGIKIKALSRCSLLISYRNLERVVFCGPKLPPELHENAMQTAFPL